MSNNETDPLDVPTESINTRHRRELAEDEQRFDAERRARARATRAAELEREAAQAPPIDWSARIDAAVAAERERLQELLPVLIAELNERQAAAITKLGSEVRREARGDLHDLRASLSELRLALAEFKLATANERAKVLDLPALPRRTAELN
jgi:hypothetical protein